jgi:hypothetical protein
MGKRLVSLLTALALAVSAFASLTVAPAGAVVEDLGNEIYFPFLPNGEEYGNMGPWYPASDVVLLPAWSWSLPIVQTNNGWQTVLFLTNFNPGPGNCSVNVDLYAAEQGASHPSDGHFSRLLRVGETWKIDLVNDYDWPTGWVGTAFITADCPLGVVAERLKAAQPWGTPVNMAITNVAQPTFGNWSVVYAPLVYQAYNGWNTGISIANLDPDVNNQVHITYYNKDGTVLSVDSRSIEPRAMEFIYLPANTDVGTNSLAQVVVRSLNGRNLAAAIDYVKYSGADQDVGQASGYLAQQGTSAEVDGPEDIPGTLSVALFQKERGLTLQRDNSGIAIFNANTGRDATVQAWFFDGAGFLVAPTLTAPVTINLPPAGGAILYAPWYQEMPTGFRGSVQMWVTRGGPVACVSNNVNYEVQFDGTATYNCFITPPINVPEPTYNLAVDPLNAVNVCEPVRDRQGNQTGWRCPNHTITATLTFGGAPVAGANILFEILDGSLHDDGADTDGGTANPTFQLAGNDDAIVATNGSGQAQFTITGGTVTLLVPDHVLVCADLNDNSVCDRATEPYAVASKVWVGLTLVQTFPVVGGNPAAAPEAGVGNTIRDWTVAVNRTGPAASVPVVLVLNEATLNPVNASFAPCILPDQNSLSRTVTAASTPFDVYACDYTDDSTNDRVFVELYWDQDGNGSVDAGEPLIDQVTLTLADS